MLWQIQALVELGSIPFWKKNRRSREIRKMMVKLKEDLR
jgi:hypothetical protein